MLPGGLFLETVALLRRVNSLVVFPRDLAVWWFVVERTNCSNSGCDDLLINQNLWYFCAVPGWVLSKESENNLIQGCFFFEPIQVIFAWRNKEMIGIVGRWASNLLMNCSHCGKQADGAVAGLCAAPRMDAAAWRPVARDGRQREWQWSWHLTSVWI
jgi:hypothetical protein